MKVPKRIFAIITKNGIAKVRHTKRDAYRAIRQVKWENHIPKNNNSAVILREYELVKIVEFNLENHESNSPTP